MRRWSIWTVAALIAGAVAVTAPPAGSPVTAATVPSGFTDAAVAGFSGPTAVEWLPGNRIVVLEQAGRVRVGRPGTGFTTAIDLDVCSNSERGLLGLTPDPGFLSNGWVYAYYTHPTGGSCVNRVSRFTMVGDTISPASELVLLDNIASTGGNHNGGDLDIGADGHLYVAVGDAGTDPRGDSGSAGGNDAAQDLSLLNGKILRVTTLGQPAPGNPFTGPDSIRCNGLATAAPVSARCQEIYAWGLRNPYRIAFDRDAGENRFFINDVGQGTYEEVDLGASGDFGWPGREGPCPQGSTEPCAGPPAGVIDPITAYRRDLGTYITAGAFVPDGLWPAAYDGTYLFGDGGSGRIWLMEPDGSVDYNAPFATGATGITDMTFGFDAEGRMVLYYVTVFSGQLRVVTPTAAPETVDADDLRIEPITPERAYDTGEDAIGVAAGPVHGATTRVVDLDEPSDARAALVNITMADTAGAGFVRTWLPRGVRPETASVNADGPGSTVGNAVVVPIDDQGRFVLEAATTNRVVVDVMAWFTETTGTSDDGRFVALSPLRLIDTREPAGTILDSGSSNPWSRAGTRIDVDVAGSVGVPQGDSVAAVVLSVSAIARPGQAGFVTVVPGGGTNPGTSSVNVVPADVRNNLVVVPLGPDDGVTLITKNVDDAVVDVLGWVTSDAAPVTTAGLYTPVDAARVVDTRVPLGFDRLAGLTPTAVLIPGAAGASAVVQTITVTQTGGPGWIVAHPGEDRPVVSNLNYQAAGQTRGTLTFTRLAPGGTERFTSRVPTDVVVDVVGFFSG